MDPPVASGIGGLSMMDATQVMTPRRRGAVSQTVEELKALPSHHSHTREQLNRPAEVVPKPVHVFMSGELLSCVTMGPVAGLTGLPVLAA